MFHRILYSPHRRFLLMLGMIFSGVLFSCGGGGGDETRSGVAALGGSEAQNAGCAGECPSEKLLADEVLLILRRAVSAAAQLGTPANIAILDRVGNVLAVYQMPGAPGTTTIDGKLGARGGLEGVPVPASLAAISKAGTGAYLSSQGQAFSTRTASQIVQEHFDPAEELAPGGPLFGVQFSQLICGDVTLLDRGTTAGVAPGGKLSSGGLVGPRPLPLGLSGDPGGFPLYKRGDLVGGIGVEIDGQYTIDRNIRDFESSNVEELVALSASLGFEAPAERVANNILVAGRALRYSDVGLNQLQIAEPFAALEPAALRPVPLYFAGQIRTGAAFGTAESGVLRTSRAGIPAMTLVGEDGKARFPLRSGTPLPGGVQLQAAEVDAILDSSLMVANRARAAIRSPLDSSARVSIFVVDTAGTPLGFARSSDAPVFGIDVALQKARTAAFFSSSDAAAVLASIRAADSIAVIEDYPAASSAFIGSAFLNGSTAMTSRTVGNLARPFYPDGIDGNSAGPLSLPYPPAQSASQRNWSPFNVGLQLDLIFARLISPLDGGSLPVKPVPSHCVDERFGDRLRNGVQIFAGSVPLYRNGSLIGAIGVSGDGIDQDDMIAFLGVSRRALDDSGHRGVGDPSLGFNAAPAIRADQVEPVGGPGTRLRYVNCPEAPFLGSSEQNVCEGL